MIAFFIFPVHILLAQYGAKLGVLVPLLEIDGFRHTVFNEETQPLST